MTHVVSIRNGMSSSGESALSNLAVAFVTSTGGVVGASDYLVQAQGTPNNTVQIAPGRAYVPTSDGKMMYSTYLDTSTNVTIASNSSGNARIDSIVLYIDLSASPDSTASNVAKFYDVQGTPAGSPTAPNSSQILSAIGSSNPYIVLANIAVANGFTSINSGNITDARATATIGGSGDTVFQSALSNFVSSGITAPTSGTLTTSFVAGVLYYAGRKVVVSTDGGHTYTASRDTYVDVSSTGTFTYTAVTNGAAAPSVAANSVRVAKVVTSGAAVTSVVQTGFDSNNVPIYPTSPAIKQSGQTLISPSFLGTVDLWVATNITLTYSSADSPVYVATTGSDMTGVWSVGMRIKLTQTTVKYFIIVAIDASTVTLYGGTDYTLANAAISSVYYSSAAAPQGFPMDPTKWTVRVRDTSDRQQANPVAGTWYNIGSLSITIPIGAWRVRWSGIASFNRASNGEIDQYGTLSTANSTESDSDFTARHYLNNATGGSSLIGREKTLVLASKTPYYLNAKNASGSSTQINWLGSAVAPTIIEAICTYL